MAQLMPLPLTVSCFSRIQTGFTFLVPAHPGSPRKGPLNGRVCVCLSLMACFSDISVSQGSMATYSGCGGIFNVHLTANLQWNLPMKKKLNLVRIDRIMVMSQCAVFWPTLYIYLRCVK